MITFLTVMLCLSLTGMVLRLDPHWFLPAAIVISALWAVFG